jgi:hypothetical protein
MPDRRQFLKTGILGGMSLGALSLWSPACRGPSSPSRPSSYAPDVPDPPDPLVELLERTDRDHVLERLAPLIAGGLQPGELLAALFAAGVRNVVPRRTFSKEHHTLLCVRAADRAAGQLAPRMRWHPLLWAVDYFKWAQAEVHGAGPERLDPLAPSALPRAGDAERAFQEAMERFDGAAAEAALTALYRAGRHDRVVDNLLRYGSRDFRHIGHKSIYVAHGLETLQIAGWERAEETLRSIALTLALHYTEEGRDLDGAWTHNRQAIARITPGWERGVASDDATRDLLATFRASEPIDAAERVIDWLARGAGPQSIWDAIFLSAAELMFDYPAGIEALHAVTTANAAYSAFQVATDDTTRRLLLLQNAARVVDFRRYAAAWAIRRNRPAAFDLRIEELEPIPVAAASALDEIFADVGRGPASQLRAAQRSLAHLAASPAHARDFGARALELAIGRAADTHDIKLPVAALQDYSRISPAWRSRYLAACTARLRGLADTRPPLSDRIDRVASGLS